MYLNLGLIGFPLSHTCSPFIHSHLLLKSGICGGYTCFEVEDDLSHIISTLKKYNFTGVNVTIPHKMSVIEFCDELDEASSSIGSVNTLLFKDNKTYGFNTDVFGVEKMFSLNNISLKDKRVLLLGAGGASRSVFPLLNKSLVKSFSIANRTIKKAEELSVLYKGSTNIYSFDELYNKEFDIVINSTSIGLKGAEFPNYNINCLESAVDMIYYPYTTPFLNTFQKNKIKLVNGFSMLLYQGVKSFHIWTGSNVQPDIKFLENLVYR